MAGTGVRAAGTLAEFERVVRRLSIPVTTAWTHDLIASDDHLYCGRPDSIVTPPLEDMLPFLDRADLERNRWPADGGASNT